MKDFYSKLDRNLSFESLLIKTFKGDILTPSEVKTLKGYESLFTQSEKKTIEAKIKNDLSRRDESCKSPAGKPEQKGVNKSMLQDIGFLKKKEEKENGTVFDLEIKIPFYQKQVFYVIKPKAKEKEGQPDFLIFDNGLRVGSIWNPKEGKKAYSGEIFSLGLTSYINAKTNDDHPYMRFLILQKENQSGEKINVVSYSFGKENYDGVTQEEQPEPVL